MGFTPVIIDPNGSLAGNPGSAAYGVFPWQNQFLIAINFENDLSAGIWESIDSGATWNRVDGATNRPTSMQSLAAWFDGVNTITVAWNTTGPSAINLQTFNLLTNSWSAVVSSSPAVAMDVNAVFVRPNDGHVIALYSYGGPPQTGSGFGLADYDGAVWTTQDAGIGITALGGWDATQTAVNGASIFYAMGSDGSLYGTFQTLSSIVTPGGQWNNLFFFQKVNNDSTLSAFYIFPGQQPLVGPQDLTTDAVTPSANGRPIIVGSQIIVPFVRTIPGCPAKQYPTLYVGTGLTSPIWNVSVIPTGIDPSAVCAQAFVPIEGPALTTDGTNILAAWEYSDGVDFAYRISQSTVAAFGTTWTASTAIGPQSSFIGYPILFSFFGQQILSGNFKSTFYGVFTPLPPGPPVAPVPVNLDASKLTRYALPDPRNCRRV